MEELSTLELILLSGLLALMLLLWAPGVKRGLERSRNAPRDWGGVLLPIGLVVLFVILLIASVR